MRNSIKKSKRHGILWILPITAVLFICVAVIYIVLDRNSDETRRETREKVLSYQQEVNEEGIAVDMLDNPYFKEKQAGYSYPKAKEITYYSDITGTKRHANIILPPNYSEENTYPVLYLMHGLGGSHRTWINKDADIILYNLMYFYGAPEMIVVLPNSEVNPEEDADDLEIAERVQIYDKIKDDFINNLMPYVNSHYSVKTGKENTAIAGNSMGGREAANIAFHYPELFGYVGLFSSAGILDRERYKRFMPGIADEELLKNAKGEFEVLMVCVGQTDEVCGDVSYDLHEQLDKLGVEHIFYDTEGGHQNTVWQNALYNFGTRIFK